MTFSGCLRGSVLLPFAHEIALPPGETRFVGAACPAPPFRLERNQAVSVNVERESIASIASRTNDE